jgi:PAS domain S-box-containing protein
VTELPILDVQKMPDYVAIFREIMRTHQLHRMELPVHHRDGNEMFVEIFISPLIKHERIAGFQIIARDISARKKLEQNLQWELSVNAALAHLSETIIRPEITVEDMGNEVLEHAKRLTGSVHGYVGIIDPQTKSLVCDTLTAMMGKECNLAGEQQRVTFPANSEGGYNGLWGFSLNTLKPFYTNCPREHAASTDVPPGHMPLSNFLSVPAVAGDTLLGQIALANAPHEYTDRDLDTVRRLAELYAMALQRLRYESELQEANEMLEQRVRERTKKLVNEIEERAKAEIKLSEGEEVARALINSPSEPVFLVAADWTIIDANAELEKRLRLPKEDILGKSLFGFIDRVSAARYREKMEAVFTSGKATRFENQLGGSWYDTVIYPVPDHQGAITKLAVFAHDITETRRLQKDIMAISELERQRIGQDLHDGLGQKLTGIAFLAEALKSAMKDKGYPEVEDIEEISSNIAESIDHARKISSGLWTTRLESYDAEKALRELADDTEILFGIICRLDNRMRKPVVNSSVVINLYFICRESINNAIKHGGAGRIDITLSDDDEFLYLAIRDDGRGAPDAFHKKTGIGLRIMQYRAGIMGGTCSFENTPGGFIIRVSVRKDFIETYL